MDQIYTDNYENVERCFEWHGYTIEAGEVVIYSPYVSHRIPEQFPEPGVFRPERFDPLKGDPIPNYAYIPFAAGPRRPARASASSAAS